MASVEYRSTVDQLALLAQRLDDAARAMVNESTAAVTRQAQANSNTGAHKRGEGHIPGSGPGPNVVTGTLRRSIRPTTPIRTAEGWTGKAGPTVVYARAVELGHPNWKGAKYPYLGPAITRWKAESTEMVRRVLQGFLKGV